MRRRMLPRSAAVLAAGSLAAFSCARGTPKLAAALPEYQAPIDAPLAASASAVGIAAPGSKTPTSSAVAPDIGPARIFPDVRGAPTGFVTMQADGTRRLIVSGIRLLERTDGSLERARETLPGGLARVANLPARLGGGLLFYVAAGGSTQLWRAKSWLDRLEPLSEVWGTVSEVIPGFDRLYARLTSGDIKALDSTSGRQLPLGPLPRATRIGQLAFADAWRAVAVVDFRGALATFDAGTTWRPVPVGEQGVAQLALRGGDFVMDSMHQRLILGPRGEIETAEPPPETPRGRESTSDATVGLNASFARRSTAVGRGVERRPLRAAIEDGWPFGVTVDGAPIAVVAEGGKLLEIELRTGSILSTRTAAFREEDGPCHAMALARGFGFVCGAAGAGTAIYGFSSPSFAMRELARFAHPRMMVASGGGGFVVRGGCDPNLAPSAAAKDSFCFFGPTGIAREIAPPGASPRENALLHPVPLEDGRALFLLPPDGDAAGKMYIERGASFDVTALAPNAATQLIFRRGFLLPGIEERSSGVLGGWILVGTELRGVRVLVDGTTDVGAMTANIERTSVAGRFAVEWGRGGRGMETVDGGMTFRPIDFPSTEGAPAPNVSAAAGPVGAAQGAWLRVGWGSSHETPDLVVAPTPKPSRVSLALGRGIALRCQPTGEASGPFSKPSPIVPPQAPTVAPAPKAPPRPVRSLPSPVSPVSPVQPLRRYPPIFTPTPPKPVAAPSSTSVSSSWTSFRGEPAPSLTHADVGIEAGTDPPLLTQARIYAWGARGSEWTLKGHVMARFDDRFERAGTRTTVIATSPWNNEERAGDALGVSAGQTVNWSALLDGTGQSALLVGQRGVARADLYAAAQGQPLVPLHDIDRGSLAVPSSVVRMGSTWFFLVSTMTSNTWTAVVYRADGGVVRRLARLPRIPVPAGEFAPRLMRRAQSQGLGLLVQGAPGFEHVIRDWYVLPMDTETGELDEPIRLFGSDLEGVVPERCAADRDGWIVSTDLSMAPAIQILTPAPTNVSSIELRLRLDPGTVCVDAIAARSEGLVSPSTAPRAPDSANFDLPLAATDASSGRRWLLQCGK